jgi:hypothetical protein
VQLLQTSEEGDSDSQVTALALDQRVLLQLRIKVGREGEYFDALYATLEHRHVHGMAVACVVMPTTVLALHLEPSSIDWSNLVCWSTAR